MIRSKQILSTIVIILSLKASIEPSSENDYLREIKNYKKKVKVAKKKMGKETRKQKSKKRAKD